MPRTEHEQNEDDFLELMMALNPTIGAYAKECIERGAHPKAVAAGLETAAATARGWCTGRFG